jgi:hypothetical protein
MSGKMASARDRAEAIGIFPFHQPSRVVGTCLAVRTGTIWQSLYDIGQRGVLLLGSQLSRQAVALLPPHSIDAVPMINLG